MLQWFPFGREGRGSFFFVLSKRQGNLLSVCLPIKNFKLDEWRKLFWAWCINISTPFSQFLFNFSGGRFAYGEYTISTSNYGLHQNGELPSKPTSYYWNWIKYLQIVASSQNQAEGNLRNLKNKFTTSNMTSISGGIAKEKSIDLQLRKRSK